MEAYSKALNRGYVCNKPVAICKMLQKCYPSRVVGGGEVISDKHNPVKSFVYVRRISARIHNLYVYNLIN